MTDMQPNTKISGAALLASVRAESKNLKSDLEQAKRKVEDAAIEIGKAGSGAGKDYAESFSRAVQAELPRAFGNISLEGGAVQMALGIDDIWAEIPTRLEQSWEGKFTPLGHKTGREIAEAAEQELARESEKWATAIQGSFSDTWPSALRLDEGITQLSMDWAQAPSIMEGVSKEGFTELGLKSMRQIKEAFNQEMESIKFKAPVFSEDFSGKLDWKSMFSQGPVESRKAGERSALAFFDGFNKNEGIQRNLFAVLPRGVQLLAGGAIGLGIAALGKQALSAADDMLVLGGHVEGVRIEFENLAQAPDEFLERMKAVSKGTVSDMELMKNANRAMIMGIATDEQTVLDLLEVSRAMARARGMDTSQYFERMTNAITSLHPTTLRSLGIAVDTTKAYENYAESIGKASNELSDSEKRVAMLNAIMSNELVQTIINTASSGDLLTDSVLRAKAAKENFKQASSELVAELLIETGALEASANAFDKLTGIVKKGKESAKTYQDVTDLARGSLALTEAQMHSYIHKVNQLNIQEEFGRVTREEAIATLDKWREEIERAGQATDSALTLWGGIPQVMDQISDSTDRQSESLRRLINLLGDAKLSLDPGLAFRAGYGLGPQSVDPIARDAKALQDWNKMLEARQSYQRALMTDSQLLTTLHRDLAQYNEYQEEYWQILTKINSVEERMAKGRETASGKRVEQVSAEEKAVRSLVQSQLSLTQVTWEDMLATQLGIYEDKPDEYLRRLRSAVHDEKSLWKDLLEGRSGAEAEYFLMQQEKAYRTGDWGALGAGFDKTDAIERIVANVRGELEAKQRTEELVNEIMSHPGLLGFSKSQVATAMGLPEDYVETGIDNVSLFASGVKAGIPNAVYDMNKAFKEEFENTEEHWYTLGEMSVIWFAEGIRGGNHEAAVEALLHVLAPRLAERLQGRP